MFRRTRACLHGCCRWACTLHVLAQGWETSMATTLTDEMRVELASLERAFGPWERSDVDDPEVLQAIVDDLRLYVGMGHQEDMSWLTTGVLAEYIESKVSLVKS